MSWAKYYIDDLMLGKTVSFRPRGNSMHGRIKSGQLCTVTPVVADTALGVNDIVLCKVKGQHYLHLVKSVAQDGYLIGNNHGGINGWIKKSNIYGRCVDVRN